jgi:type IV pilus assembly protein PilO
MKASDFRNLDFNNVGGWAQGVKLTFCVILFALIVFAGWWFEISSQQEDLQARQSQETRLKREFSEKQAKVVNLEPLKRQLDEMREMLSQLLRQLPSKTEMPELLIDISQTALSAGIQTQLFQPGPEAIKEGFYAEQPIKLRMMGTYHQFGAFISGVAALPRVVILTMHDVSLKPVGASGSGELSLDGTVKTYRYVEEDENAKPASKPGQAKGRK